MDSSSLPEFVPSGDYRIEMIVTRKIGAEFKRLYAVDIDTTIIKN